MKFKIAKVLRELLCLVSKKLGAECASEPGTTIQPIRTIDINLYASICLDSIEQYGDADLHLPDMEMKIYRKQDVIDCEHLKEISSLPYIPEEHDCDDFAAKLFGKWAGLAWSNIHALNFFVDENLEFWFIEPQTRQMSKLLDAWQGSNLRFLIGR